MPTTIIMTYDAYASYDVPNDVAKKIKDGTYKSYNKHGTLYWVDENGKENKVEAHDYQEDYKRAREDVEWDYNEEDSEDEDDARAKIVAAMKAEDDSCSVTEDDIHQCKECKDFFDCMERDGKNGICGDCFCCCECGCQCQTECFTIGCGGGSSCDREGCKCECHESTDSSDDDYSCVDHGCKDDHCAPACGCECTTCQRNKPTDSSSTD